MTTRVPVEDRQYYTTAEVERITGISVSTLCRGVRSKDPVAMSLSPMKIGRALTWPKAAVDRWVAGERSAA